MKGNFIETGYEMKKKERREGLRNHYTPETDLGLKILPKCEQASRHLDRSDICLPSGRLLGSGSDRERRRSSTAACQSSGCLVWSEILGDPSLLSAHGCQTHSRLVRSDWRRAGLSLRIPGATFGERNPSQKIRAPANSAAIC